MSDRSSHAESLQRAQGGDAAAFATLIDAVVVRLLGFLRKNAGRSIGADAGEEDLLQTVLSQAWRLLPGFVDHGRESFFRWLITIARHAIHDRLKYVDAKLRASGRDAGAAAAWSQIAASMTSISRAAVHKETVAAVMDALARLPAQHRDVVTLHLLEGQSLSEIGSALGITKNAVWERLHHGLATLRSALRPAGSSTP